MATRKDDFVTITSIIKREIQKRKKQKKSKDELINCIPISNASAEDETELILFKKKKKKKKRDKIMVQNENNFKNDIATLKVEKFYTETYSLLKKKKKKKKRDKKMLQNDENMNNHIGTLEVDEFYTETCDENNKHLIKDKTLHSNLSKDEFSRNINISKISEGDSLFKKKKKKKKRDKKMLQNDENMNNHIGTLEVDEFYTETCDENNKHLIKDKTLHSNLSKDEFSRNINISKISEGDSLFKKKKKKKKRDKKMLQNDENMSNHIGTLEVDEFYTETCDENNKHLIKDKTLYSNLSKDEFSRNINISKISDGDSLFKKKKKKKKRDKKMLQNDENMNNHIGTLEVDEFYTETCDENNKHLIKDKTLYSNLSIDEFSRNINISKISEGDSLFKKKKKKKKRDKKMLQNDENMNNHIGTLEIDEFFTETCDENNKHLIKDKTLYSNLNKDEFSRNINISKISEGDSLFKKKKKKKKRDKIMVQNDNNFKNDVGTLKEDEFYTENCDENNKHLFLDETMDSNFSKDEFTRSIFITNDSEGDLLFKKKKKKKRDKKMVQIDKYLKNDKATLKVQQFYNDTCNDKIKHLNKINISGSNLNRDNSTTSIQIANASEDDEELTLLKSPLKKSKLKKKESKAKKEDTESSKYESIQKNFKNVEDLKKCISEEQSNEIHNDPAMIKTPYNSKISKVYEEEYLDLFQKLFKNKKKDKKKIIKAVTSKELVSPQKLKKRKRQTTDREYSKNDSLQSVDMDMETYDSNNYMGEDCGKKLEILDSRDDQTSEYRTMTDTDFTMLHTSYNSRTSKVHKEGYPELILKLLKNKKREQKNVIKAVTRKEIMSPEKSNKRKQAATDKEYSKNDSLQPVAMDMEIYDSNNYMGEDGGNKLEILDSRDDQKSEYRTMTDTGIYFGQYCNQTFNNVNGVHSHENVLTGNTPLQCDVCFKTFSFKSKLHIHERTHTGEKPYACNVCGLSFSVKGNLVKHTRTHSGERPYACNICGNSFSQKSSLVSHTRTHTGEKPYACNICGNSFSHKSTLVSHKRTHTGEKPYACDVCGNSFSHKKTLVSHTRTHTGEKPYGCDVCGRSFTKRITLTVHYRIHTGERPYECGHCEKKFSSSGDRGKHTRVHIKCF